jgi:hypothetical protein
VNGGGDVNISNPITLGFTNIMYGYSGYRAHSLSVSTAGNINVTAVINAKGALDGDYNSNSHPDGGNVTLNSTAGSVKVTSKITASGALFSGNVNYSSLTGGLSGDISITGVGGVSISAALEAWGRSGNGDVTINTGNSTVTSGGGVNDGVSSVISGDVFTKRGVKGKRDE